jgi:eukaryotic-like serine/threonine-protein kinase
MTQPRLLGDRYELDGVVGRGGMAEVYRAHDIRLDRTVAVKTLRADLARDATFQARFRREAQSSASLNNPTIVAVYDTGEDMSTGVPVPFIVMEYVDGRTLRDLLIEGHRLLPERTLEITSGVLKALEYSHQSGIVHRDIKPGNVMVTRNGDIKVMDFGIARAMNDAQATMTQTAQVIGTAQYLSPEQARGERVGPQSDVYSTGCLMYELLTGRPPFTGDSPVAIAYQHVRENPTPPSQLDPTLPPWADQIVLKAMAKSTTDRYQSAADMNADIQRAASGMQTIAALQPPTQIDDFYDQRTQRLGQQTAMGGAAPTTVGYQSGGYQPTGYQQSGGYPPDNNGGYYGGGVAQQGGGRKKAPWIITGILVLAAVIVAVVLLKSGGNVQVPAIPTSDTYAQAQQALEADGLKATENPEANNSLQAGYVISTNPGTGASVAKGSSVQVNVSTGPAKAVATPTPTPSVTPSATPTNTVPDVSSQGFTASQAQSVLNQSGYDNVSPDNVQATTGNPAPGTVYGQIPAAGTPDPPNSTITILVEPMQTASPTATPSDSTQPGGTPTTPATGGGTPTTTPTDTGTPTPTDSSGNPVGLGPVTITGG